MNKTNQDTNCIKENKMPRRDFLTAAGSFILASGAMGMIGCRTPSGTGLTDGAPLPVAIDPDLVPTGNPPNFVFVLTDDHRWDHLSAMNHPFLETPNMDRLAKEGVLFENAFVTTSLCSPSRASFLTGQ